MRLQHALALASLCGLGFSVPQSSFPTLAPPVNATSGIDGNQACASIALQQSQQSQGSTSFQVSAELGFACLNAVPIVKQDALALVDSILPYLEFQSTLTYLKNPPKDYPLPPVDILAGMQTIRTNVQNDFYKGEYAFQLDIANLLSAANDGHLAYQGDALDKITFLRAVALVSVSSDGKQLPQLWDARDVYLTSKGNATYNASAITAIDGQDPVGIVLNWTTLNGYTDLDVIFNAALYTLEQDKPNPGTFNVPAYLYPNASIELTFANGTIATKDNHATVNGDWSGIDSGQAFYSKFCGANKPTPTTAESPSEPTDSSAATTVNSDVPLPSVSAVADVGFNGALTPGFPYPVIMDPLKVVGGYFLNDTGYTNVAVLNVPSFETPEDPATSQKYMSVVAQFLSLAKAAGKTKLIIDLQTNGGGNVFLGYAMFLQLFPNIFPFGGSNVRANQFINVLGVASDAFTATQLQDPVNETVRQNLEANEVWFSVADLKTDNTAFKDWADVYGPVVDQGDNFTNEVRYNLTDPLVAASLGLDMPSYINNGTPPYAASDIIMLTDGQCGSTCTIFAEMMKQQAKVKTVVIGGRPQTGAMQGIAGVRGSQAEKFSSIYATIQQLQQAQQLNDAKLNSLISQTSILDKFSDLALNRSAPTSPPSLNLRNALRIDDPSLLPLQFRYEAADCKIWFTPPMVTDITATWKAAAQAAFNDTGLCVDGSVGAPTSLSGNSTLNSTGSDSANGTKSPAQSSEPKSIASVANVGWATLVTAMAFSVALM